MTATIESSFEANLQEAVLNDAGHKLAGKQASLVYQFVELVHTHLRAYGQRHNYDVESTIDSLGTPVVDRSDGKISVTVGWEGEGGEQMSRFEFGVPPHTISGDPLAFIWENPPEWVKEEFDQARSGGGQFRSGYQVFLQKVEHPGIPESRAIRDSLNGLRRVLRT